MLFELFILYWIASIIFLFFPQLIHRKKKTYLQSIFLQPGKVIGISHRGGMLENYDNSITAFAYSDKIGIRMLEMDVQKTKDNKYIVIHDYNLKRVTGQDLAVKETEYNEIGPYLNEIYCDYGFSYTKENVNREKPCLLEEFFTFLQKNDLFVHLDIKTCCLEDIDKVITMAIKYGISQRIVFAAVRNFDPISLKSKYGKDINLCFTAKAGILVFFYFFTGLLPFIKLNCDFFTMPYYFKTFENSLLFRVWKKTRIFFIFIHKIKPLFKLLVWHLQQRSIPVIYFVANCEEDFDLAVDCRANGIMTDKPKVLMTYLQSKSYC